MKLFVTCCLLVEGFVAAVPVKSPVSKAPSLAKVVQSESNASTQAVTNASVPAAPAQHRAKLDVGFASFEKSMLDQLLTSIHAANQNDHWSQELQVQCKESVTQALSQGLKSQLATLKQSIGKTWMSLPEDDQKDAYVSTLRQSYEPTFKDTLSTIDSHLQRVLKRQPARNIHGKALSKDELLKQCTSSITSNILDERCYDVGGGQHTKKPSAGSFLQAPKNFCMPSVFEALEKRLKDSQGLIGMTMQFESKSLSLQPAPGALDSIVNAASAVGK